MNIIDGIQSRATLFKGEKCCTGMRSHPKNRHDTVDIVIHVVQEWLSMGKGSLLNFAGQLWSSLIR